MRSVGKTSTNRRTDMAFVVVAAMQIAAVWVSFLGPIANR